jgi:hypothetical protein
MEELFAQNPRIIGIMDTHLYSAALLRFSGDEQEHSNQEAVDYIVAAFSLSTADSEEKTANGKRRYLDTRVERARLILKDVRLIESTRRGHFQITTHGLEVLQGKIQRREAPIIRLIRRYLTQFELHGMKLILGAVYDEQDDGRVKESHAPVSRLVPNSDWTRFLVDASSFEDPATLEGAEEAH